MKIAVVGLFHLGSVTAACLANAKHDVLAYDQDPQLIAQFQQGKTPIFEPGLDDLVNKARAAHTLHFSAQPESLTQAEIVWVTYDTPVDDNDIADVVFVTRSIEAILPYLSAKALILISSQMPVGTTRKLIEYAKKNHSQKEFTFACSPENLRLGKAIDVFTKPDRVIVGLETESDKARVQTMLAPFTQNIVWMSIESAEMTKHALNAFLATSVVFINELATLCERVGADARDVERGLKTEERIGPKAYLRPGGAIAGGTLARDVNYLMQIGEQHQIATPLFSSLLESNAAHKQWSCQRLLNIFKDLKNKTIATLGLTYKSGTDTLRRSAAVEICEWLSLQGAKVSAYDPAINALPEQIASFIDLKPSLEAALAGADAVIIATECPQFTTLTVEQLLANVKQPLVFDASGFLMKALGNDTRLRYFSVGRQA